MIWPGMPVRTAGNWLAANTLALISLNDQLAAWHKLQAEFTAALWVDDTGCYPESLFNVGRETGLGWDAN